MTRELRRSGGWLCAANAIALLLALASVAQAQTLFSPDITAPLGTVGPSTIADDDAAADDGAGTVTPVLLSMLGAVPPNAEVAGLELSTSIPAALSLDITAPLPGLAAPAEPRDVVSWDPNTSTFSLTLDGSANGIPAGARIDAISRTPGGVLMLSFDTTVTLPGGVTADDEDLVAWFPGPVFLLAFDGSANGVAPNLDLDAASRISETGINLLLSFDGSGVVGGIPFDDEDTLAFFPAALAWAMYADASLSDPVDYPAVDVVALPEPGSELSLCAGAALLALLARRPRRR